MDRRTLNLAKYEHCSRATRRNLRPRSEGWLSITLAKAMTDDYGHCIIACTDFELARVILAPVHVVVERYIGPNAALSVPLEQNLKCPQNIKAGQTSVWTDTVDIRMYSTRGKLDAAMYSSLQELSTDKDIGFHQTRSRYGYLETMEHVEGEIHARRRCCH